MAQGVPLGAALCDRLLFGVQSHDAHRELLLQRAGAGGGGGRPRLARAKDGNQITST